MMKSATVTKKKPKARSPKSSGEKPACEHERPEPTPRVGTLALARAPAIFRACGDPERLRLLERLAHGEQCVSELAAMSGEGLSTVSQRLRLLRSEGIVGRRREGKHIFYALSDQHVSDLLQNALEHAAHETAPRNHGDDDE